MLNDLYHNSAILNVINLVLAIFLFFVVARKKINTSSFTGIYNRLLLLLLFVLLIDSVISDIIILSSHSVNNLSYYLILLVINLSIIVSISAIWLFFSKKHKLTNELFIYYLVIFLFLSLLAFGVFLIASRFSEIKAFFVDFFENFEGNTLGLKIIGGLVAFFFTAALIIFFIILISRIIRGRRERRTKRNKNVLSDLLGAYIYAADEEKNSLRIKIYRFISRSKSKKQLAINEIVNLNKNIRGEIKQTLYDLYLSLNLHEVSLKKLRNRRWYVVAAGFRELSEMNYLDAHDKIRKRFNSNNSILRREAIYAASALHPEEFDVSVLSDYKYELNLWDQINLHYRSVIRRLKIINLDKLIESKNESVLIFAMRMIRINKLTIYEDFIIKIVNSCRTETPASERLRFEAYETLMYLNEPEITDFIFDNFYNETYPNKLKILEVLIAFPNNANFPYLKNFLETYDDFYIRMLSSKAIYSLGRPLNKYLDSVLETDESLAVFVKHVKDKRI